MPSLGIILGDQLNLDSPLFQSIRKNHDALWMCESQEESVKVPSSKIRTAMFLSAMRHYRESLQSKKWLIHYTEIHKSKYGIDGELLRFLQSPEGKRYDSVYIVKPGEFDLQSSIQAAVKEAKRKFFLLNDTHFITGIEQFKDFFENRKQIQLEYYYRYLRKQTSILMDKDEPVEGRWNFDSENRAAISKNHSFIIPQHISFSQDQITRQVFQDIETVLPDNPAESKYSQFFDWPVTANQAEQSFEDFVRNRLPSFGKFQDAMLDGEPFLFHSRISAALNLKLLNPVKVIHRVESEYRSGKVPVESAEGFIRQVLGWREYVRGIYWNYMPEYREMNFLDAEYSLPDFYWNGNSKARCLSQTISQTLRYGYAHHIQRLMITGLFAMLYGVNPKEIHEWYLAVYVDAVEWVELPNTLGMSQYADGGIMATKPYCASANYINKMSNYCKNCFYDPRKHSGERACPFNIFYRDFLIRNSGKLRNNPRLSFQYKNLDKLSSKERTEVQKLAQKHRENPDSL